MAIAAGSVASSTALIGFGLDSIVEVLSAAAVAEQFAGRDPEARERTALRVVAISFFGLALVVSVDAVLTFTGVRSPEHSPVGIVLAAVSLPWSGSRCARDSRRGAPTPASSWCRR